MDKCADLWYGDADTIGHIWMTLLPLALGGYLAYVLFMFCAKIYFKKATAPVEATITKIEEIDDKPTYRKFVYRYEYQGKKYRVAERRPFDEETDKLRRTVGLKVYKKEPGLFLDHQFKTILKIIAYIIAIIAAIAFLAIASAISAEVC